MLILVFAAVSLAAMNPPTPAAPIPVVQAAIDDDLCVAAFEGTLRGHDPLMWGSTWKSAYYIRTRTLEHSGIDSTQRTIRSTVFRTTGFEFFPGFRWELMNHHVVWTGYPGGQYSRDPDLNFRDTSQYTFPPTFPEYLPFTRFQRETGLTTPDAYDRAVMGISLSLRNEKVFCETKIVPPYPGDKSPAASGPDGYFQTDMFWFAHKYAFDPAHEKANNIAHLQAGYVGTRIERQTDYRLICHLLFDGTKPSTRYVTRRKDTYFHLGTDGTLRTGNFVEKTKTATMKVVPLSSPVRVLIQHSGLMYAFTETEYFPIDIDLPRTPLKESLPAFKSVADAPHDGGEVSSARCYHCAKIIYLAKGPGK